MTVTSRVYDPHATRHQSRDGSLWRERRNFGATAVDGGGKWLGGLGKRELGRESETRKCGDSNL